jgi:SsrA-binding protein
MAKAKAKSPQKTAEPTSRDVAVNRRAFHDYDIVERIDAGIELTGSEIKSIRAGKISLQEAYARPNKGEIWLVGAHIAEYGPASYNGHEPRRSRRLLLHKGEIQEIEREVEAKGLTLIPLKVYLNKRGLAKVELGLARGRKQYDKRAAIAKRDADREVQRALRERTRAGA